MLSLCSGPDFILGYSQTLELLFIAKDKKIFTEYTLTVKQLANGIFSLCGYNDSEVRFHEELKKRIKDLDERSRYGLHCNLLLA